jgi:hypothetical protein
LKKEKQVVGRRTLIAANLSRAISLFIRVIKVRTWWRKGDGNNKKGAEAVNKFEQTGADAVLLIEIYRYWYA